MYDASRTPHTVTSKATRMRRVSSPWPDDRTKATQAITTKPRPHATSMTLYRPSERAISHVRTTSSTAAAAEMASVAKKVPLAKSPIGRRPHQDLVDAHASLLEGEAAAD